MSRTPLSILLILLLAAAGACSTGTPRSTPPPGPRPVPGPATPELEPPAPSELLTYQPFSLPVQVSVQHRDSIIVSLGNAGDQVQVTGETAFFTIATRPIGRSGPHILEVTLDSVTMEGGDASAPISAVGVRWSGDRTERGVLDVLTPTRGGEAVDEISHLVSLLFPALPEGGARVGARWNETRTRVLHASPFQVRDSIVATYRADSLVTMAGMQWLHLAEEAFYTREGMASNLAGATLPLSGFGISSMSYYVTMDGRLVRAAGVDSTSMTISSPETGARIPVRQISRIQVSPLP